MLSARDCAEKQQAVTTTILLRRVRAAGVRAVGLNMEWEQEEM